MIKQSLEAGAQCVGAASKAQENNERAGQDDGQWELKNERRGFLIDKQFAEGLNPAEAAELCQLQAEIASYLARVAPISFEAVEALEAVARRIGALPASGEPHGYPG
jgi:hypothetical protein